MNKRDFIKTGFVGTIALICIPAFSKMKGGLVKAFKTFKLPELPYAFDALEPHFNKETITLLYSKNLANYTENLNTAISNQLPSIGNARELLSHASWYNRELIENGGGYLNHKIFLKILSPNGGGPATGKIAEAINSRFGSFANFKEEFSRTAKNQTCKGWVWLINQNGALKVVSTSNQGNPFMDTLPSEKRGFPLLCVNVWGHLYQPNYKYEKEKYIDAFWEVVNWDAINTRFNKSIS
jgi:Fe-Mn family superoxide dismutase